MHRARSTIYGNRICNLECIRFYSAHTLFLLKMIIKCIVYIISSSQKKINYSIAVLPIFYSTQDRVYIQSELNIYSISIYIDI